MTTVEVVCALQGGRGTDAAEYVPATQSVWIVGTVLQGGRGTAAEYKRRLRAPPAPSEPCFNEAAARMPRNIMTATQVIDLVNELQGGRGIDPRNIGHPDTILVGGFKLQGGRGTNAAEYFDTGHIKAIVDTILQGGRSNMPRNMKKANPRIRPYKLLQGGRGTKAADNGAIQGIGAMWNKLQGGRSHDAAEHVLNIPLNNVGLNTLQGGRNTPRNIEVLPVLVVGPRIASMRPQQDAAEYPDEPETARRFRTVASMRPQEDAAE